MRKFNFYKLGLLLGLVPIVGLGLILLFFWFGLSFFAQDNSVDGIGFLYIMISVPIIFIGLVLTIISIFKRDTRTIFKPIFCIFLIFLNLPAFTWILKTYGEISSRAYLKVINNSDSRIDNLIVKEPDNKKDFGSLEQGSSKVIYFNPDYKSPDGRTYPGIEENYLLMTIQEKVTYKKIPIIHPGETHQITIDKNFNLMDIHLNKIVFNK